MGHLTLETTTVDVDRAPIRYSLPEKSTDEFPFSKLLTYTITIMV